MMQIRLFYLLVCLIFLNLHTGKAQINTPSGATVPFNSNPGYSYGLMPTNLPTSGSFGKSQAAADAYNHWKQNWVETCSDGLIRVRFDTPSETVSEGIAYGMLLAAYAADKNLFDGLWRYYKRWSNGNGVMHWKINGCNSVAGSNGATDAELDAAMALIVAACQWPSASIPYNYTSEATALINAIKEYEIHPSSFQTVNGDAWGFNNSCRNPSYQSPAYYKIFAEFIPSQASFWNSAVEASYTLINNNAHSTTGLVSNWSDPNGSPNNCNGPNEYGYDACRNPWRMATDVLWYNDSRARAICNKIAAYTQNRGVANVSGPVPQSGGGGGYHNTTFVSTFSAGVCGADATYQTHKNNMYAENVRVNDNAYFGMTLRAIMLFMETGNFWKPCGGTPSGVTVSITSPSAGTNFSEGSPITINATATTTSGSISKIEFFYGNTKIGEDLTSPYSIVWNNAPAGTHTVKAVATTSGNQTGEASITVNVYKSVFQTSSAPVIDGTPDALWNNHTAGSISKLIQGSVSSAADLSATWKATWDNSNLYVLVQVTDDSKRNDGGTDTYNDDAIEIYVDIGNNKLTTYGDNDFQFIIRYNDPVVYETHGKSVSGITFAQSETASGYVMEVRIPWSTLTGSPAVDQLVGFDVHVNDDDNGGERDGKLSWNAATDDAWQNPSLFGTIILKGANCTAPSAAGSITGNTSVCASASGVTYSIASVTGATGYTWTVPSGASVTAGQNTNSITVTYGSTGGTITVTPTNSCGSGTPSTLNVTVNPSVAASVSASASATTICSGSSVTFTATPVNGGTNPTYRWQRNGVNINGATSSTYSTSNISNGDKFRVIMTSNANCVGGSPATSAEVIITVNPSVVASVSASASATTICSGSSVTFTATPVNGGTNPTYRWQRNGVNINGATSSTYSTSNISNGDKFRVIMTSNANCVSSSPATSGEITMAVNPALTPSVTVSASATTICSGDQVSFTATAGNGGASPTYQWQRNGVNINGATQSTYTSSSLANNDQIRVIMTSNESCLSNQTATSAAITLKVDARPSTAIAGPDQYISSTSTVLQANNPLVGTGQWSIVSGSGWLTDTGNPSSTLNGLMQEGETVLEWTISNGVCPSSSDRVIITVGSEPAQNEISGPSQVVAGETVTYSVPYNNGSQYNWTVPPGATIVSGQGTNTIQVVFEPSFSGTISVTETNSFGTSTSALTVDSVTGFLWSRTDNNIKVYPNPFSGQTRLRLDGITEKANVKLTDLKGTNITDPADYLPGDEILLGDDLNEGIYLLHIHSGESVKIIKLVKSK